MQFDAEDEANMDALYAMMEADGYGEQQHIDDEDAANMDAFFASMEPAAPPAAPTGAARQLSAGAVEWTPGGSSAASTSAALSQGLQGLAIAGTGDRATLSEELHRSRGAEVAAAKQLQGSQLQALIQSRIASGKQYSMQMAAAEGENPVTQAVSAPVAQKGAHAGDWWGEAETSAKSGKATSVAGPGARGKKAGGKGGRQAVQPQQTNKKDPAKKPQKQPKKTAEEVAEEQNEADFASMW